MEGVSPHQIFQAEISISTVFDTNFISLYSPTRIYTLGTTRGVQVIPYDYNRTSKICLYLPQCYSILPYTSTITYAIEPTQVSGSTLTGKFSHASILVHIL